MLQKINSDEKLIQRSLAGDRLAFCELVERHQTKVAGIIRGMLGQVPEVEDVGQEVFIRFFNSMASFKGESSLGTYLGKIAINLSLNALQRQKRDRARFTDDSNLPQHGSNEEAIRNEAREIVWLALSKLEPEFRSVLVLRMLQGYSTKEASEILNLPQGTILSRLSRAQEKFRQVLEKLN